MSSIDPIQQPVRDHADINGNVPSSTNLWDKNAKIVDEQLRKTTAFQQSNGYIGLSAPLLQDIAAKDYKSDATRYVWLSSYTLYWNPIEAIINGVYCKTLSGNSDDPELPGFGIANYLPASDNTERQHLLVIRNRTRLDSENWPEGIGDLELLHGATGSLGVTSPPSHSADMLPIALVKTQRVSGVTSIEMLPLEIPKSKLTAHHDELQGAGRYAHAAIDGHIDSRENPHLVNLEQAAAAGGQLTGVSIASGSIEDHHIKPGTIGEDKLAFAITNNIGKILYPHFLSQEGTLGLTIAPNASGVVQMPMDREIFLDGRLMTPSNAAVQGLNKAIEAYYNNRPDLIYPLDTLSGDDPFTLWSNSLSYNPTDGFMRLNQSAISLMSSTVPLGNQKIRHILSWSPSPENTGTYAIRRYLNNVDNSGSNYAIPANYKHEMMGASGVYAIYCRDKDLTQLAGLQQELSLDLRWGRNVPSPVAYSQGTTPVGGDYWDNEWSGSFSTYFTPPLSVGNYQLRLEANSYAQVKISIFLVDNNTETLIATASGTATIETPVASLNGSETYRLVIEYRNTNATDLVNHGKLAQDSFLVAKWRYAPSGTLSALTYSTIPDNLLRVARGKGFYTHVYTNAARTEYQASMHEGQLLPASAHPMQKLAKAGNLATVREALLNLGPLASGTYQIIVTSDKTDLSLSLDGAPQTAALSNGNKTRTYTLTLNPGVDYRLTLDSYGATGVAETLTWKKPGAGTATSDILDYLRPNLRNGLKADFFYLDGSWNGIDDPFATGSMLNYGNTSILKKSLAEWGTVETPAMLAKESKARMAFEWSANLDIEQDGVYQFLLGDEFTTGGGQASGTAIIEWGDADSLTLSAGVTGQLTLNKGRRLRLLVRGWRTGVAGNASFSLKWQPPGASAMSVLDESVLESDLFLLDQVEGNRDYKYLVESNDQFLLYSAPALMGETDTSKALPSWARNFRVTNEAPYQVDLAWSVPDGGASNYNIVAASGSMTDFSSPTNTYANLLGTSSSLGATGLTENTIYYFYIEATNASGKSSKNFARATTTVDTSTMNLSVTTHP